jgi:hypothetical protein
MQIARRLFAAFLVLCLAHPVLGQTEKITLYADAEGSDCSVTDTAPAIVAVYMFHVGSGVRKASRFMAPKPACWTGAVWVGDVIAPDTEHIGSTQGDFAVNYNVAGVSCFNVPRALPIYIGKINYFLTSIGPSCCEYPVLPSPNSEIPGSVITIVCDNPPFGTLIAIGAGKATINENEDCPCNPPLAIEESTWGRVKALYH